MLAPDSPVFPLTRGTGVAGAAATMVPYATWRGSIPGVPGEKVLIRGHVNAGLQTAAGVFAAADWPLYGDRYRTLPAPPQNDLTDIPQQSSAMVVKIAVRRARFPGWTLVDADSWVVMDAGDLEVAIIGPGNGGWYGRGGFPETFTPIPGEILQFIDVRVTACPVRCCYPPPGRMTVWSAAQTAEAQLLRTHVRPRRATKLHIIGSDEGGSPFQVATFDGDPNAGGTFVGQITNNAGFVNAALDPWGCQSHLVVQNLSVNTPVTLNWEITG